MRIKAIYGSNGSGKTLYVDKMRKQMASDKVRYMAFRDSYGVSVDQAYYLQLRWNQHDIDAETPNTGELLEKTFLLTGPDTPQRRQYQQQLYSQFGLESLMDKYIITLSSGELRKFQLAKTLLAQPHTLIIDNPFIGLDSETRQQLRDLLQTLAEEQELEIWLVVSRREDIPDYVTEVIEMEETERKEVPEALNLPEPSYTETGEERPEVIRCNHVSIRYGERTILRDLDWTVRRGEHWSLSGQNGSGKSTLLSLVCADNPQSYACDIELFGQPRGSGESIWDIKRRIGYVSPEMHRSYQRDIPALRIVASGLKDSVGLYVRPTEEEKETCRRWMRVFGIGHLEERSFLKMSSGEQRLVLLARAFVKSPSLLILDEPLHGLDSRNRQLVRGVIEDYCRQPDKTLIFVTHYQEDLPPCIDHSLYLQRQ